MVPVLVFAVVLSTFGLSACQNGQSPDLWKLDAGEDSSLDVADLRPEDVGVDSLDALDTTGTRDTSDVAPLDCTCAVEGATCKRIDRRAVCIHDNADCSDGSCPKGFVCRDGRCGCDFDVHGPECRPECTDHGDCGQKQYCNLNDRCFPRRKCNSNHALCPPGYWCDPDLNIPGTCRRSEERPVGATCEKDWTCESGICGEDGTCLRSCFAEEDCPGAGQACAGFGDTFQSIACYTPSDDFTDCKVSCPEDRLCDRNECLPHACHRTGQCPEGDCVFSPRGFVNERLGQCTGEERLCNEWEFRIAADDPFCRLGIDCDNKYNPEHFSCPEGYECVQGEPDRGRPLYTSWCSRRVTDGEWP